MYIRQVNKELLGLSVCKIKTENERLRIKKESCISYVNYCLKMKK